MELPKQDPLYEDTVNYARIDLLWIANLVDTYNSAMQILEDNLMSIDTRLTNGGL